MKRLVAFLLCLILLSGTLPAFALTYDELLQKAEEYAAAEDTIKAFACYNMAVQAAPDRPDAHIASGNLHLFLGEFSEAYADAESALAIDPTLPEGRLLRCRIDIASGDAEAFDSDVPYAEICGVDLSPYFVDIACMYANARMNDKALIYFTAVPLDSLDESQKTTYSTVLIANGKKDQAEELGLATSFRDAKLDAAFETGKLKLIETSHPYASPSVSSFDLSDDVISTLNSKLGSEITRDQLEATISEIKPNIVSLSPAGNSGILMFENTGFTVYNNTYHFLIPSASRGVEDKYGNLDNYFQLACTHFNYLIGEEGIVYSQDGKYAAIIKSNYVFMNSRYFVDPIIIDLSTGEMLLTATYPSEPNEDGTCAVTAACFSSDSLSFFYTLYGKFGDNCVRLCHYDIKSQVTTILYETKEAACMPRLYQDFNGNLILLSYGSKDSSYSLSFACFEKENDIWTLNQSILPLSADLFYPTNLLYSDNSTNAIILGELFYSGAYSFVRIKQENVSEELNQYFCLTKSANEIITLTATEYEASITEHLTTETIGDTQQTTIDSSFPYQYILKAVLSPDGNYAIIDALDKTDDGYVYNLYMVRLEDMDVLRISGIDAETIRVGSIASYQVSIEWNTDTLIIGTKDGIKTYQFDY